MKKEHSISDNPGKGFEVVHFDSVYRRRQKVYSYDPDTGEYSETNDKMAR